MTTLATSALERYVTEQIRNQGTISFDEIIFANIPNLTASNLANVTAMPPVNQIVHRQAISQVGVVNENAVVYSVTMGTEIGDFNFNFIGLVNRSRNLLAVAIYTDTIQKIRNKNGVQGNSITRSILLEFTGAKNLTNITIPAQTWQIDFTARLHGLDEKIRLTNRDLYGRSVFFDNGFKVTRGSANSQYFVEAGAGYIEGVRAVNSTRQQLTVQTLPCAIYVDVVHQNTVTGAYQTQIAFLQREKSDWKDSANFQHYVEKIAEIDRNGNVTDVRNLGGFIPNSKKSNSVNSSSNDNVATSSAVKTAYDKGVDAQTAADNAQRSANNAQSSADNAKRAADNAQTSASSAQQSANEAKTSATNANNNANGRVSKAGDTMTGHLTIQHGEPRVHGKRGNEMGWYVGFPNANDRDVLWHNYLYNTNVRLKSDKVESNKEIYVGTEKVHHTGDSYAELSARDSHYAGLNIVRSGNVGSWSSRIEALPDKRWKFWVQNSHEILLPAKGGTVALTADVVAKGGDTMTGILEIDTPNAIVRGRRNGNMGWYVGFPSSQGNDLYLNSYIHNTRLVLQADRVYSNRDLYVGNDKVHHAGDSYARLSASDSGYAGLDIVRTGNAGNWSSRIEALPNKQWKFWVQGSHEIVLPAKGGTVALTDDVVAKGGDTMTGHLNIKVSDWSSVRLFNTANKFLILETQPDNANAFGSLIYRNANNANEASLSLPKKRGVLAIDEEVVSKSGDTMTGHLTIQHGEPRVHGKRGNEMGWYVGFPNANDRDVLWHNYLYNTNVRLKSDKVESNKEIYVGTEKVHHTGDSYARLSARNSEYAGLDIVRTGNAGNWASRIEALPDKRWKFWVQGSHEIHLPAKSGTVMLEGDFATKARSLVNRRDYNRTVSWGGNNVRMTGSVTVYPDGRIEQIIHVKAFRMIWLGREAAGTGGYGGERGFQIPVQLWTAMPSKITKVHAQTIRATEGGSHTYYSEAGEWNVAWQLFGNTNERNWVNLSTLRLTGNNDEPIDLYLVVEGY